MAHTLAVRITTSAEGGGSLVTIITDMLAVTGSNCEEPTFMVEGDTIRIEFLLRQCEADFSFNSQV